jgi:hypothetical protein
MAGGHFCLVDHIDRKKLNNKTSNLREASHRQNSQNCITNNKIIGTTFNKKTKKWKAQILIAGKCFYLGQH